MHRVAHPFKVVRDGPAGKDSHEHTFSVLALHALGIAHSSEGARINGASSSDGTSARVAVDKFCAELNKVYERYIRGEFHETDK